MITPWAPGQPPGPADLEEPLDLLVDAADGLDLALLVERAGDGQVLPEGDPGEAGQDGVDLRRRGAVAVDARVGLLEGQGRGEGERLLLGVFPAEVAAEDEDALVVGAAAHVRFALDVDDAGPAHGGPGRDAGGLAEHELAHVVDREAVDLADDRALGVDHQRALLDHLLDPPSMRPTRSKRSRTAFSTSSRPAAARPSFTAQ